MTHLGPPAEHIKIPDLKTIIELNENVANACGILPKSKVVGISLNTLDLSSKEAEKLIDFWEDQTNLPVTDVIRFGSEKLITAIKYFN
jgi:uncharacterized NAD-dependent epimerase/dehydratase family protein